MLNRSEIFKDAWSRYRAQMGCNGLKFSRRLFANYLRAAYASAKGRILYEAACAEQAKAPARVRAIRAELLVIEYSDAFLAPRGNRQSDLCAELARLVA